MRKDAPIGVFDSGVGGLTVAREIIRQIPNERIVYFWRHGETPVWNQVNGHDNTLCKADSEFPYG